MKSRQKLRYAFSSRRPFAVMLLLICLSAEIAARAADVGDYFDQLRMPSDNKWVSYGQGDTRAGSQDVNSGGQVMVPLWQNSSSLLFSDLRGRANDHSGSEGNFGLGFRQITSSNWIVGAYGYYDLRNSNLGNTFQQATLGVEAMSVNWDARFNAYIPDGKAYTVSSGVGMGPATPVLIGNQLALSYSGAVIERSYYGFDGEAGYLLASSQSGNAELRAFVGGYDFQTQDTRFPSIVGVRSRLEGRLYDLAWLLGDGSRLVAGFEYQYDRIRESQYIGLVQVRIPLRQSNHRLSRLERRMLDTVVRDVDVVSQADMVQTNTQNLDVAQVHSPIDGRWESVGPVAQANSSSNLSQITQNLGAGSTVFVDGSNGPINVTNPIVMNDSQRLFGGGEELHLRGATTHDEVNYIVPGSRPTLIGTNQANDVVIANNNTWIQGFTIQGGNTGISTGSAATPSGYQPVDRLAILNTNVSNANVGVGAGDLSNSLIQNVTSSNNSSSGFLTGDLVNSAFIGNTANQNANGFQTVGHVDLDSVFQGNAATNNSQNGFLFSDRFSGFFLDNVASYNAGNGIQLDHVTSLGIVNGNVADHNQMDGINNAIMDGQMTYNTVTNNAYSGIGVVDHVGGLLVGNLAKDNGRDGFYLNSLTSNAAVFANVSDHNNRGFLIIYGNDGLMLNNLAINNSGAGMQWLSPLTGYVVGNVASHNGSDGFLFTDVASNGLILANQSLNNGGNGLYANIVDGTVFYNVVDGNALEGMYLNNVSSLGIVDHNLFENNGHNGYYGFLMDGTFTNNTALNNSWSGIGIIGSVSGLVDSNIANNNVGHGFYLNSLTSSAVVSNNSADHNATGFTGVAFNGYFDNAGLITNNTATNNAATGFFWSQGLTGTMSNNTATNNGTDGFGLGSGIDVGGQFTGNSSVDNSAAGYNIPSNAGYASGNTGSGNGGGNDQYP